MAKERFLKLGQSFLESDYIDYMMTQPNGAAYVLIYQFLWQGIDAETFNRWFSEETVEKAMELYKKLGLMVEEGGSTYLVHEERLGIEGFGLE